MNITSLQSALYTRSNMRAFLRVIREGESSQGDDAYRTLFGGGLFGDMSKHPNRTITANGYTSTAAGAYQFLSKTWNECRDALNLRGFTPAEQDLAAVFLIQRRGALDDVLEGRIEDAITKCNKEWASLPGSPYGQPVMTMEKALRTYRAWRENDAEVPAATPVPPTPEKRQEAPMPAPPRPDAEPYAAPVPQPEKPMIPAPAIPFMISLAGTLIDWFKPVIKEKVTRELDRHVGNTEISGQIATSIIETAQRVTGKSDPVDAVSAAKADPAAMAKVEESALEHLQRMAPLLDKLQSMDRERWAADEASRDAASRRAAGDPNDQDRFLTRSLVGILVGLLVVVGVLIGLLAWLKVDSNIISGLAALFTVLATGVNNKFSTRVDHRYGSSSGSVAKDAVLHELSRDRK